MLLELDKKKIITEPAEGTANISFKDFLKDAMTELEKVYQTARIHITTLCLPHLWQHFFYAFCTCTCVEIY